jgi:putative tricarboxylic transport membrane protein
VSPPSARRDRWSAAGLAVLALGYLLAGRRYPLDTLATPGPGIFPLGAGLVLLAIAVWQLLVAAPRSATRDRTSVAAAAPADDEPPPTRAPLLMSLVLVLYAATLPVVGFVVSSIPLVFIAARLMGLDGWWRPAALALGVTLVSRVLFVNGLGVTLP